MKEIRESKGAYSINEYRIEYSTSVVGGTFTVYCDEIYVGKADIHLNRQYAKLKSLYVKEEYRGKGIGKLIVKYIFKWCDENKVIAITVHAASGIYREAVERGLEKGLPQKELEQFYKDCGFNEKSHDYLHRQLRRPGLFSGEDVFWKPYK